MAVSTRRRRSRSSEKKGGKNVSRGRSASPAAAVSAASLASSSSSSPRKGKSIRANRAEMIIFRRNNSRTEAPHSFATTTVWLIGIAAIGALSKSESFPERSFALGVVWTVTMFAVLHAPDCSLTRPHPMLWRAIHGLGMAYLVILSGLCLLTPSQARAAVAAVRDSFGKGDTGLGHTETGKSCAFEFEPVWRQLTSLWFVAHVAGFFGKMIMFRDVRVSLPLFFSL